MKSTMVRHGKLNTLWGLLIGTSATFGVLVVALVYFKPGRGGHADRLVVFCAAGIRVPVEEIATEYEEKYKVVIELQFGGSETLLNQLDINKFGDADLYLAADEYYMDQAVDRGIAAEVLHIAHQRPVIAVQKDNKNGIKTLDDLLRDDVRVVLGSPEGPAIGRVTKELLQAVDSGDTDLWTKMENHVTKRGVFKPTVNDVAQDVKIGSMDAGIVWRSTVEMPKYRDDLEAIPIPHLDIDPSLVAIAVLNSSPHPASALKFARYLSARDRGLPRFQKYGFNPVDGDTWVETPQLTFFCGAVNRRAVEKILDEFQQREGIEINTQYNGCGILTSTMSEIADQRTELGFPDVYMACDVYYLENVKQWFQEAANVSDTDIVIAVPKGSTKVQSLDDLVKPDVIVAVGEPKQCTIGALARRLLQKEGLYEKLQAKKNAEGPVTVVEKSSSALLVPDVTTGSVDAAIAYITDTLAERDKVDIVRIDSTANKAIQPFSISRSSEFKHLSRRLFKRIADSPEAFETVGFNFRLGNESAAATNSAGSAESNKRVEPSASAGPAAEREPVSEGGS